MVDVAVRLREALDGQYAVEEAVGQGGMSIVLRALDLKHNRTVAIKVLRPELSSLLGGDRFHREIEYAAQLNSPYILPLFDSGEVEGSLYYVMPFVPGGSLADRLERDGPLSVAGALEVACNVASALVTAHEQGIVHRDIKPGNILFSGDEAVVSDFGVARAIASEAGVQVTRTGVTVGSPPYMSPEQGMGDEVDERSDVYSLGCVLHAMLTGHPPFVRKSARATIAAHVTEPPPSVRDERPDVPRPVDELIRTALQKDPEKRFASAAEMLAALEHPDVMPDRARDRRRRRWLGRSAVALPVLAALALVAWIGWRTLAPESLAAADANRVMVFPVVDLTAEGRLDGQGSGLAAGVGYALEETRPLRWIDGWDWLSGAEKGDPGRLTHDQMRQVAREHGAGYYVYGTAVDRGDSLAVVLRLFDSESTGSHVARSGNTFLPGEESVSRATIRAVGGLLPTIIGEPVDVSELTNRDVRALANWTIGLSELRDSQFAVAFDHFRTALAQDSLLVLAGVDGAVAAMWLARIGEAQKMADAAINHDSLLAPRHRNYAHGIRHYAYGRADSTVRRMQAALRADTAYTEAWFALGEAFLSLMPSLDVAEEVAEDIGSPPNHAAIAGAALETSLTHDPTYSPSLARLADVSLLQGDTASAADLLRRFFAVDPDSTQVRHLDLILRCFTGDEPHVDWEESARTHPWPTLSAAVLLSRYGTYADCAEDGYRAVLEPGAADNYRWGAVVGLQSLLVARGRIDELKTFLGRDDIVEIGGSYLYPLDAWADPRVIPEAALQAAALGTAFDSLQTEHLWVAGEAAALVNDATRLTGILGALRARAGGEGRDEGEGEGLAAELVDVFAAHLAVAMGDTTRAITLLRALEPRGDRQALRWNPWTPLAPERIRLAELLLATGRYADAVRVAELLDHPQPVHYVAFQPASLSVRIRAQEALGNHAEAAALRERAAALGDHAGSPGADRRPDAD